MRARLLRSLLSLGVVAGCLAATPVLAADPVQSFSDWSLYVHQDKNGRLCYIASAPKKQDGNFSKRGQPAVMVAKLPSAPPNEQVSVQPGYTYKAGSPVSFTIDGTKRELFTQGDHAWAKTSADDRALITGMRGGSDLKVGGTSSRGTTSMDTYSLAGFTAAYKAMQDRCKDAR